MIHLPKRVVLEKVTKKGNFRLNIFIMCGLYQKRLSEKYRSICFQECNNISKKNNMKKVNEDMNVFRKYFGLDKN